MTKKVLIHGLTLALVVFLFSASSTLNQAHAATIFSDDFTDTNGTLIHDHNSIWEANPWGEIQNNQLHPTNFSTFFLTDFYDTTYQCVSIDATFPLQTNLSLTTRYTSGIERLFSGINSENNTFQLYAYTGNELELLTNEEYTPPSDGVHRIKQCSSGTITTLYLDDQALGSMDTSSQPTGTAGIKPTGNDVDNFLFESIDTQQLTEISPAEVWVSRGLLDLGLKLDLLAEVYADNVLVSSGSLNSVTVGSGGFFNADPLSIPFSSFTPVAFPEDTEISVKVSARNACSGSLRNSGTARLWFNDSEADSHFDATIGNESNDYFLRDSFQLATTAGSSRQNISVAAGAKCSPFKPFGTWTFTP